MSHYHRVTTSSVAERIAVIACSFVFLTGRGHIGLVLRYFLLEQGGTADFQHQTVNLTLPGREKNSIQEVLVGLGIFLAV